MNLQDYQELFAASDVQRFERKLVAFAHHFDFGIISAAIAVERPGHDPVFVLVGNTPKAFAEAVRDPEDYKRDPVLQRLKSQSVPFSYDQNLYVGEGVGHLWEEQACFGFRTGISMASHLPGGRHFLMGVDREQALPSDDQQLIRLTADLQLLAVHAQEAAFRLLMPEALARMNAPSITAREREVLQWTMEGKSAWTVGQLLSMSEHTVNFHLRNAMRKFDASTKQQAALRAREFGLI
jgi:DNA-binding CsgD family transcriptional regulator